MNYLLNNQREIINQLWRYYRMLGHTGLPVLTCSALTGQGVSNIWDHISDHHTHAQETGAWSKRRSQQQIRWMWSMVEDQLIHNRNEASIAQTVSETEEQVLNGDLSATEAAKAILALFKSHHKRSSSPMLSHRAWLIPVGGLEN